MKVKISVLPREEFEGKSFEYIEYIKEEFRKQGVTEPLDSGTLSEFRNPLTQMMDLCWEDK